MTKAIFDLCYKNGEYTDRNGDKKGRWLKIGTVFESDKGLSMLLDMVPAGAVAPVWISLFPIKDKNAQNDSAPVGNNAQSADDADSDAVPF